MSTFRAIWTVVDPGVGLKQLMDEAVGDLPAVARRHGLVVTGTPRPRVARGQDVPGSAGAETVVLIDVEAVRIRDLPRKEAA